MAPPPDFSKIRAFFFDAGGTLFQPYPSVGEIYSEVAGQYGLVANSKDLEIHFHDLWHERDGLASLSNHTGEKQEREWWRTLVWDVFSHFGEFKNFEGFFEELYDRFARAEAWRLFPDTLPALQKLKKQGKIIGIVSNWDSRLFGICEGLSLMPYLDFVLASAVVGSAKPSPKIFKEAVKKAGVAPHESLHVGDSLEDDILGAQRAGVHAVFLDRHGKRRSDALTISSLQSLCSQP